MDRMERHRETGECHKELLRISQHIDSALRRMNAAHMTGWVDELSYIPEAINEASRGISGNAALDVNEDIKSGNKLSANMLLLALHGATPRPPN